MTKSPNSTDIHVGARVRMRRLMLNLSQTELGDALGVTFQQVQKYEKGANRIGAGRLQQISSFLQVPIPFFFEGLPPSTRTSKAPNDGHALSDISRFTATSEGLALIKAFMQIDDAKLRRCIVRLIEGIALQDQ